MCRYDFICHQLSLLENVVRCASSGLKVSSVWWHLKKWSRWKIDAHHQKVQWPSSAYGDCHCQPLSNICLVGASLSFDQDKLYPMDKI